MLALKPTYKGVSHYKIYRTQSKWITRGCEEAGELSRHLTLTMPFNVLCVLREQGFKKWVILTVHFYGPFSNRRIGSAHLDLWHYVTHLEIGHTGWSISRVFPKWSRTAMTMLWSALCLLGIQRESSHKVKNPVMRQAHQLTSITSRDYRNIWERGKQTTGKCLDSFCNFC